jgi:hypothetical protein
LDKFTFSCFKNFNIVDFALFNGFFFYNISTFRSFFINYSFFDVNSFFFHTFSHNDFSDIEITKNIAFVFGSFTIFTSQIERVKYRYVFSLADFSISLYVININSLLPVAYFKYSFIDYKSFTIIFNNVIKNNSKTFFEVTPFEIKVVFSKFFPFLLSSSPIPFSNTSNFSNCFFIRDIIFSKFFSFQRSSFSSLDYYTFSFIFNNFCKMKIVKIRAFSFYKNC